MPQKNQINRLEELALKEVGEWVKMVGRDLVEHVYLVMINDPKQGQLMLQQSLENVRETLYSSVPWYLYEKMSTTVLTAVDQLVEETKSDYDNFMPKEVLKNKVKVSAQLTEVVIHPLLKKIMVSDWPKLMRLVLHQNFNKLVGLEEFDLGSVSLARDTAEIDMYLLPGIQWTSNLTSFCLPWECTDCIINAVSGNCPLLQKIDVSYSEHVTDGCLSGLLNCKQLRDVQFNGTNISPKGFKSLLTDLPKIQNIGAHDKFDKVLELLYKEHSKPLPIVSMECGNQMNDELLRLVVEYFPNVYDISIEYSEIEDLSILSALNLKVLKMSGFEFYEDKVKEFLEKIGSELESLHLIQMFMMDLNAIMIISQCCPKLKALALWNNEFKMNDALNLQLKKLSVAPFACLEHLTYVYSCGSNHLEFILKHSKQVKSIKLGSSTEINDSLFSRVLGENSMACLEELVVPYCDTESVQLSKKTLDLLMVNCENLCRVKKLESWSGLSAPELSEFREFIYHNNINLNTMPDPSNRR